VKSPTSIERNLILLGGVGLGLFVVLVGALFVVQTTMGTQQRRLQQIIVPIQQDVAGLEGAIAAAFAREADVSSTGSTAQLEPMRNRTDIERRLTQARISLKSHLVEAGDDRLRKRAETMNGTVEDFLSADAALFASMMRTHSLDSDFRAQLGTSDSELHDQIVRVQDVAGRAKLAQVLLLRRIATGEASVQEVVSGPVRVRGEAAQDLQGSIQRYAMLVALIGTLRDADALNSMIANELPQAHARVVEDLGQLAELTTSDPDLAARVTDLQTQFERTGQRTTDRSDARSVVSLRYATFTERVHASEIRELCRTTAQRLLVDARGVESRADEIATRASRTAAGLTQAARYGSLLLALLGIGVCAFSGRRIMHSVAELRATNQNLSDLKRQLLDVNEGLEHTVAQRTSELRLRERSLQLVLDTTGDGLISVATDGRLLGERSRAVGDWFGSPPPDMLIWNLLYPNDPRRALTFQLAWAQLMSDELPFDVALEQMPHSIEQSDRLLQLEYKPVREKGRLVSMLVTVLDVTARRTAERAERDARAVQAILANVLKDPAGFRRGMAELAELTRMATHGRGPAEVRRALHTLKGNAAIYGLSSLTECCHAIEERLYDDSEQLMSAEDARMLESSLRTTMSCVEELVGPAQLDRLEITREDLAAVIRLLDQRRDHAEVLSSIERWLREPTARPLATLAAQARRLASRLGKQVEVDVFDGGVRVDPDAFAPLWMNLVHAIRNAVDHGIEPADVRTARGKPEEGRLVLRCQDAGDGTIVIDVTDDGGGIDLEAVRAAARQRGLACATEDDLIDAVFLDGLSTRSTATDVSGRGFGLGALRHACSKLGGTVRVSTTAGLGTTLSIRIPSAARRLDRSVARSASRPPPAARGSSASSRVA